MKWMMILLLFGAAVLLRAEIVEVEPYTDYRISSDGKNQVILRRDSASGEILCSLEKGQKEKFFNTASASRAELSGKAEILPAVRYLNSLPEHKFAVPGENIARGKSYTLVQAPNYPLCKSDADSTKLTDGKRQQSGPMFWTQKANVVGWMFPHKMVNIIMDLGKIEPVAGVGYGTAGGISGVNWPNYIYVLVSDDGKTWRLAGDLVQLSSEFGLPPAHGAYHVRDFASARLNTRGRYIQLAIVPSASGCMTFIDEIEVWRGKDNLLKEPVSGSVITDMKALIRPPSRILSMQNRLRYDTDILQAQLKALKLTDAGQNAKLSAYIEDAYRRASALGLDHRIKKSVFPLGKAHEILFSGNLPVLQAMGLKELTLWKGDRWENTSITALPDLKPSVFGIEMMKNEVRSECVNLTNPTSAPLTVNVKITGISAPLKLYEVIVSESTANTPAASALLPLKNAEITIPPGCTRQLWISCEKPRGKAGTEQGNIIISGKGVQRRIPFTLKLHDLGFPEENSLLFGGWDYMIGDCGYYGNAGMADRKMEFLRHYGVNTAWAHAGVLPTGAKYDGDGKLLNADQLNWKLFDEWLKRWNGAKKYSIFLNVLINRFGEKIGTPRFNRMVGDYFNAIAARAEKAGISRSRLLFELVDEPTKRSTVTDQILPYLRAMKSAKVNVEIFENPLLIDEVMTHSPELFREVDIICFDVPATYYHRKNITDARLAVMKQVAESGKTVWLYECAGPALTLDPATYYRGLSWHAAKYGAKGIMFWAFGCTGNSGSSWNPYDAKIEAYSPFFIDDESIHTSKQMEAIREGMADYEYLLLLRRTIDALKKSGKNTAAADGEKRLKNALETVLAPYSVHYFKWSRNSRGEDLMEKNRLEILHWLAAQK